MHFSIIIRLQTLPKYLLVSTNSINLIPCPSYIEIIIIYLHTNFQFPQFSCTSNLFLRSVTYLYAYTSPVTSHLGKIANLISKLNFYKLIPYAMDNCFTSRRDRSRQTPEKDVLYIIPAGPVSSVHSLGGASYLLPV